MPSGHDSLRLKYFLWYDKSHYIQINRHPFQQLLPYGRAPNKRWEFVTKVNVNMEGALGNDAKVIEVDLEAIGMSYIKSL